MAHTVKTGQPRGRAAERARDLADADGPAPAARRRPHRTLPVALLLEGRPCLVVGGGLVAARKAGALCEAGARVTLVAPELGPDATALRDAGAVTVRMRAYRPSDLAGRPFLVVTATDDAALNRRILDACHRRGLLCACPDRGWEHGDLISPASFRHEELTISVSTGGASCRRSRLIKESLQRHTAALGGADLLVVGVDHRRTRLALREEFHLAGERRAAVADMLRQLLGLHEFLLLDTCNRVELVGLAAETPALVGAASRILGFERLRGRFYVHQGFDAFRHVALTVAGLHSQSPGETHIRAQVKEALAESRRAGWSAGVLHDWIGRALRIATAVRRATADLLEGGEIEDLCVAGLEAELGGLADRRVLVIGGGTVGRGVVERLHARGASVTCAYRTRAPVFSGAAARAVAVQPLGPQPHALLRGRDAVVCASGGGVLLGAEAARNLDPGGRMVVADLGVPRNVAPDFAAGRPGIRVVDLDDLKRRDRRRAAVVRRALAAGERVVQDHAADYERLRHGLVSSRHPTAPPAADWSS